MARRELRLEELIRRFDATAPVERAETPPSAWYLDPELAELERRAVVGATWQLVGPESWLTEAGAFVADTIAGEPVVVVRGADGVLRAFSNVCRHHAAEVASGRGCVERLVCPYHGWEYDLAGRLRRAPRMGRVEGFERERFGLPELEVGVFGPLVLVRVAGEGPSIGAWLAPLVGRLDLSGLRFVARRRYELRCNWKVFVDNYLDGGYHVDLIHGGLAAQLELESYRTEVHGGIVLQVCEASASASPGSGADGAADFGERVAGGAVYAWVYPNLMLNRYGPFLDTNVVLPLGPDRCAAVFDYYVEDGSLARDEGFLRRSLEASDRVQQEDVGVCESVQRGLASALYDTGRYAPALEHGMHHFHRRLAEGLLASLERR
jgi:choline monooxygenase